MVSSWDIVYKVRQIIPEQANAGGTCYDWTVIQEFKFEQRNSITMTLDFYHYPCEEYDVFRPDTFFWLQVLIITFSLIHFALNIRYIQNIAKHY